MYCALCCMLFTHVLLLALTVRSGAVHCGSNTKQLRLRSTSNGLSSDELDAAPQQLDLSQLSESQLQQVMQQLNVANEYEEDNRGSIRPWNKVQRIIRRQLVRIPKRYLKKILRQFGLARSGSNSIGSLSSGLEQADRELQLYYLIPLE
ncbi:GH12481 [Drosophila grimshawi]|uniref:GH12481 n=1 Tax=Drosophila grimshawi TaxID=7222 RepID=B4JJF9_DROGR|nr:GH12481 [Drosophila grimshawi]